ncbi:MAG: hypothetical protein IID44_10255 [Planctomycetes bacterium]|nr:hypothetical protein [Planctomycetota bacterium]
MNWIATPTDDGTWKVIQPGETCETRRDEKGNPVIGIKPDRIIARGLSEKEACLIAAAPKLREYLAQVINCCDLQDAPPMVENTIVEAADFHDSLP